MHVRVIEPPEVIVTWEEAKMHLRLDSDDEKTLVEALALAVSQWLDGPNGWLARSVGEQTLEGRFNCFSERQIAIPFGPVVSVETIKYLDADGEEQTLDEAAYTLLSNGTVSLNSNSSWPAVYSDPEAVRVRYVAGYAPGGTEEAPISTVPAAIKVAALLVIAFLFRDREASPSDALSSGSVYALLSPYRIWSI